MRGLSCAVADAEQWPEAERRELLQGLDRAVDALATVRATVLLAERRSGAWQGSGDGTFEAWRGRTARTGLRSAAAQVRQAEHLDAVPALAAAVTDGRIGLEHAAIIGRTAGGGTPAQRTAAASPAGQEHLLRLAERLDAGTFATAVARWASAVDPAALEQDHQAQRGARYLHVTDTPRGTFVKGQLDSMAGHRLTLALEALSPRPGADDDRDAGQRRADALDAMAGRILAAADTKPGGHVPPQVSILLSEATWVAARDDRDRRRAARRRAVAMPARPGEPTGLDTGDPAIVTEHRSGDPSATSPAADLVTGPGSEDDYDPAVAGYAPATLEDGTPVPASELARAMCDCEITRIVIDADGVPLDLGRAERVFTGQQRRAVIARDRECAWPECHAPARWCEIHHIRWWERDTGPTSVDNGVLLCSYHHHEVHRRDLSITRVRLGPHDGASARATDPTRTTELPGAPHGTAVRLALVGYRFCDPTGRSVGDQPQRARKPPDGLDLDWTTDPVTGVRVPAWFAAGGGGTATTPERPSPRDSG